MEKLHSKWAWLLLLSSKWEWLVLMSKWALRLLLPWLLLLLWQHYEKRAASLIFASFTFNSTGCLFYRRQRHTAAVTHTRTRTHMHANLIETYRTVTHTCTHWFVGGKLHSYEHAHTRRLPCIKTSTFTYRDTHFCACIYTHVRQNTGTNALTWRKFARGEAAMSDGADGGDSPPSLKQNNK